MLESVAVRDEHVSELELDAPMSPDEIGEAHCDDDAERVFDALPFGIFALSLEDANVTADACADEWLPVVVLSSRKENARFDSRSS